MPLQRRDKEKVLILHKGISGWLARPSRQGLILREGCPEINVPHLMLERSASECCPRSKCKGLADLREVCHKIAAAHIDFEKVNQTRSNPEAGALNWCDRLIRSMP